MPFDQVVMRARLSLRSHGFRILSEMPAPVAVGESGRRHLFMNVWEQVISTGNLGGEGLDVGDHLVCNVVVFEEDGLTWVAGLDPTEGLEGWSDSHVAESAKVALAKAIEDIGSMA